MKRTIEVKAGAVTIKATIDSSAVGALLTRSEVEAARDSLADALMDAAANVKYLHVPLNRVKVR